MTGEERQLIVNAFGFIRDVALQANLYKTGEEYAELVGLIATKARQIENTLFHPAFI